MTIYKVLFLDELGREVGEFGYYEAEEDAERRRAEVAFYLKQRGTLEIRGITPEPPSNFFERRKLRTKSFYDVKCENIITSS